MNEIFERSLQLLGTENFNKLKNSKVAVFGVGGVGGTTVESLVRSGFSNICIADFDDVSASNINRQILFTKEDIGKSKVAAAEFKLRKINEDLQLICLNEKVNDDFFVNNSFKDFSFIVDAIDDTKGKLAIAKYAIQNSINFVMCLGMGNRIDPSKVRITTLDKTSGDPLARKIRSDFRKEGLDISKISVVVSDEIPLKRGTTPSSLMMVPSSAGLLITFFVIKNIII